MSDSYNIGVGATEPTIQRKLTPIATNKPLAQAKAMARSGDTIIVPAGSYAENDLLKDGVNWHFMPGAVVTWTDVGPNYYGIFDDRSSGAVTCTISGSGVFASTLSGSNGLSFGVVNITNAGSNVVFQCRDISVQGGFTASQAGLVVKNCTRAAFTVERIYDPTVVLGTPGSSFASGVYWENGNCFFNVRTNQVEGYGIWSVDPGGSPNVSLYYTGQLIEANGTAVYHLGNANGNANYRMWVNCLEIKAAQYGIGASVAGKLYIDAQKLSANLGAGGYPAIALTGSASSGSVVLWARIEKVSLAGNNWVLSTGTGQPFTGEAYLEVLQWEDLGTVPIGFSFPAGTTGKVILKGGIAKVLNGKGMVLNGGTVRAQGVVIDTSNTDTAANTPITVGANGLTIENCTLVAGATNGISVQGAFNVKNYQSRANKAAGTPTFQVDTALKVDANVA